MGRFLPLLGSTIAAAGATVTHRVWGGVCLFPVLTRAGLCSLAYAQPISHSGSDVLFLV